MENQYQQAAAKLAVELAQAKYDLAVAQVQIEAYQKQAQEQATIKPEGQGN